MKYLTGFLVGAVLFLAFVCAYQNRIIASQRELIESMLDGSR